MLEMYRRDQFRQELLVDRCSELARSKSGSRSSTRSSPPPSRAADAAVAHCECGAAVFWGSQFCGRCGAAGPAPGAAGEARHQERADTARAAASRTSRCRSTASSAGSRLPTNRGVVGVLASAWQRRFAWYPGDWVWPVLLFLVIAVVAAQRAVAAARPRGAGTTIVATPADRVTRPGTRAGRPGASPANLPSAPAPTITDRSPKAPGAPSTAPATTPTPPEARHAPRRLAGRKGTGYTDRARVRPRSRRGRAAAVARARARRRRRGLPRVGVLVSSQYSSLHPGYYVVFSGIYSTPAAGSRQRSHSGPCAGLLGRLCGPRHAPETRCKARRSGHVTGPRRRLFAQSATKAATL